MMAHYKIFQIYMANKYVIIDENGMEVKSEAYIASQLLTDYCTKFGVSEILTTSPIYQIAMAQANLTTENTSTLLNIKNNITPSTAVGKWLDSLFPEQKRQGATNTTIYVSITSDRALTLNGLDISTIDDCFKVADGANNTFSLLATADFINPGTQTLLFQCDTAGNIQIAPNTIQYQASNVEGIVTINNANSAHTIGSDGETDAAFLKRAENNVNPNSGDPTSLMAILGDIEGVTDCLVIMNNTTLIDTNAVPAGGYWIIVDGGSEADIGNAIKNWIASAPMKQQANSIIFEYNYKNGISPLRYFYNRSTAVDFYVRATIKITNSSKAIADSLIKSQLVALLTYKIGTIIGSGNIGGVLANIVSDFAVVVETDISLNGIDFVNTLIPGTLDQKFTISATKIDIIRE